ncbi:MAG TPA: UbiA-like polyprenyltransferase [Syntrophomonadaceae bacterium]|nr:UbiA-like polyprenyltransferase [Syntrophomonadaceae bacterium]
MRRIKDFLNLVDFAHTLFGLPFAYLGAFLALRAMPTWHQLIWITLAMMSARTAALCLNRLIDLKIDRANPRTVGWVLPAGKLPTGIIWLVAISLLAFLLYSAAQLNLLCLELSPLALIILWGYSYTKRYTWWCHLILGMAIGIGPVGAWIAVTGSWDWRPLVLGMAVACWIAGFDTMYACQDIDFDRHQGLYSIPARFGARGALIFSAIFHTFTIFFLLLTGFILGLSTWYYSGVVFAAVVLSYEHWIVRPEDLSRVNHASFKINHYVGLIIFATTLLDVFMKKSGS